MAEMWYREAIHIGKPTFSSVGPNQLKCLKLHMKATCNSPGTLFPLSAPGKRLASCSLHTAVSGFILEFLLLTIHLEPGFF